MMEPMGKGIAIKLVNIMGACAYAQKDGKNDFHRYKYVSAANILEKVNAACVDNRVASIVSNKIVEWREATTSKGNKENLVTVEATLTLIDADTGETVVGVALGTGQDPGDKAVAKAQTMAIKYAWMTTLNISTGDDPEADSGTDRRNTGVSTETPLKVSETSLKVLRNIKQQLDLTDAKFLAGCIKGTKREITSLEMLTEAEAQLLIPALKKKVEAKLEADKNKAPEVVQK